MVLLKRKAVLLAKAESTYGTNPTPSASTDALLTIDVNVKRVFEPVERNDQIASMSHKQSVGGKKFVELSFQTHLYGSGAPATAPRLGTLFQACEASETVNSPTDVTYAPTSTEQNSVTFYVYLDGMRHIITGCVGNWKMTATAGAAPVIDWTFMGLYQDKTDTAIATPTFESTVDNIPVVKSASLQYDSTSLVVNEFTLDCGNTIAQRPSVNGANAIVGFHITDRKSVATIDPEAELVATLDLEDDILANPAQLQLTIGQSAGNRVDITIPKANPVSVEYGDREGTLIETITYQCADNGSGDDEWSLQFD